MNILTQLKEGGETFQDFGGGAILQVTLDGEDLASYFSGTDGQGRRAHRLGMTCAEENGGGVAPDTHTVL